MAEQDTLIYIDEKDVINASITAKNFAKEDVKNRVYYNSLGAELVKKFLASENVDVSNMFNIHSIQKILEHLDISDVMLSNIHIDVRVVFNENYIFVPKSHFEYDILPDVYLVLLMSSDKKYMKFLGFFDPKLINKNNQNSNFYFIEKEKLTSPVNLKEFIARFEGKSSVELSESEIEAADMMMLSMVDNDITESDKKRLLQSLVKSAKLRDRFIEFENFELLAFGAQSSPDVVIPTNETPKTLDYAASATAIALLDFNNSHEDIFAEADRTNAFADSERDLPGLASSETEEDTSELDLMSLVDEVEAVTAEDVVVENLTTDDVSADVVIEDAVETFEYTETEAETVDVAEPMFEVEEFQTEVSDSVESEFVFEQNEMNSDVADFEIVEDSEEISEEDSMLNQALDESFSLGDISNDVETVEFTDSVDIVEDSSTVIQEENTPVTEVGSDVFNFEDMATVEAPTFSSTSLATDTVSLDEIELSTEFSSSQADEIVNEAIDLNDIKEVEVTQTRNHEVVQETVDLEHLPVQDIDMKPEELTLDAPSIELESFDNLDLAQEEQAQKDVVKMEEQAKGIEFEKIEIPSFSELTGEAEPLEMSKEEDPFNQIKHEGLLTEVFNKELAFDEEVEEEVQEEIQEETLQVEEPERLSFDEIMPVNAVEDVVEESYEEKMIMPEEVMISDEDKELDAMLNTEDFTTVDVESIEDNEEDDHPELFLDEVVEEPVAMMQDEIVIEEPVIEESVGTVEAVLEEAPQVQEEQEETIADWNISANDIGKASLIGGVEYEESQELSTGELISQIDDLLSSEEGENSSQDAQVVEDSEPIIELEGIKIPETIQDAEDYDTPEILSVIEKDETAETQAGDDDDKLELLFNSTLAKGDEDSDKLEDEMLGDDEPDEYQMEDEDTPSGGKKNLILVGAALVALLVASAGGFFWWKNNNELADLMAPNPIENDTPDLSKVEPDIIPNIPDSEDLLAKNAPESATPAPAPAQKAPVPVAQPVKENVPPATTPQPAKTVTKPVQKPAEVKKQAVAVAKPAISGTPVEYTEVKSISWEVPDYLSYSDGVKKYLQIAGKSIRLRLSSDLLLATEPAYSNQIKVGLVISKTGVIENIQIIKSSGSDQINEIVLRTVKDTLNVVKPASGEVSTDNFKLGLIINI